MRKSFGDLTAVDGVDLDLRPGEVHALLGENGAGKTTLMKILAGILKPDEGKVEIGGQQVSLRDRRDGTRHGIGMIQQHFALIEEMTAAENYLLGHPQATTMVDLRRASADLKETGERLDLEVRPGARVADLTMGERQRLEIVIALSTGAQVLVMDEPTAALGVEDAALVMSIARRLAAEGKAVVLITHKLHEVMDTSDRVSVLRRGRLVLSAETPKTSAKALTEAMVEELPKARPAARKRPEGKRVAHLDGVSVEPGGRRVGLEGVTLEINAGEVLGIAGVVGNGQDALAGVLTGFVSPKAGRVELPTGRVAYVPEDRAREGLAQALTIRDNAIVHRHREPSMRRFGRISGTPVANFVDELLKLAEVRAPSQGSRAGALSGGNQQKLVLARELDGEPLLIVADNPYRGLDIRATADVRERLLAGRDRGAGVVMISPDLDELFDVCDRLAVLFEGRVVGELDAGKAKVQDVGRLMAGEQ